MSTYTDASLIYYPSGYKAGKAYSLKPTDGSGDLDFTRASTATRVNESGLIEEVAANVPRLDNSQGGCSTLLLEPQRTNLILNSEGVLADYNTKIGNLTDASTSINSFANSIQVGDNSVLSALYKSTQSWAAGPTYSFSFFVQMDDNSQPIIGLNATTGDFAIIVGGVLNNTTAKITRINSTDTYLVSVSTTQNGGSASYGIIKYTTQSAKPFRITAMQNEIGSYPTSYIPTTSTAVTRVADVAGKSGISSLINSEEGVLYVEFNALADDRSNSGSYAISDGTTNNRFIISNSGGFDGGIASLGVISGALVFNILSSGFNVKSFNKVALKYELNNTKLFANGVLIGTDTSCPMPVPNTFNFLGATNGTSTGGVRYGNTKGLMLFPTALSDAECIALTTL